MISTTTYFCLYDVTCLLLNSLQNRSNIYRDRAAERRALHGGFGVAPGQKNVVDDDNLTSSSASESREEAAAEALNLSFGSSSYARRILKSMGWKEVYTLYCYVRGFPVNYVCKSIETFKICKSVIECNGY